MKTDNKYFLSELELNLLFYDAFVKGSISHSNWNGERETSWTNITDEGKSYVKEVISEINNNSIVEQDIEKLCDDCCDDHTVDINNEYIGKVFQWLINNDYIICKK